MKIYKVNNGALIYDGNIYNLTDDVLISGEPKFGKDKPRQWNILQVFPEILDFIKANKMYFFWEKELLVD